MINPYGKQVSNWLDDEQYAKAVGQLRLQLNEVMSVFRIYGQDVFIPDAISEVIKLCEDFGLRVRGVDKPIIINSGKSYGKRI